MEDRNLRGIKGDSYFQPWDLGRKWYRVKYVQTRFVSSLGYFRGHYCIGAGLTKRTIQNTDVSLWEEISSVRHQNCSRYIYIYIYTQRRILKPTSIAGHGTVDGTKLTKRNNCLHNSTAIERPARYSCNKSLNRGE